MSCLSWRGIFRESWKNKIEIRMGGLRETGGLPPFFSRKGALTHHLQSRRWYPSRWSGSCAPHELSSRQFSRGGRQCRKRTFPVQSALYLLYQQNDEVAYCHPISPPACENLPLAAFTQLWVSHSRRHPFSLFKRETERKDGEAKWQSIIWKQK